MLRLIKFEGAFWYNLVDIKFIYNLVHSLKLTVNYVISIIIIQISNNS